MIYLEEETDDQTGASGAGYLSVYESNSEAPRESSRSCSIADKYVLQQARWFANVVTTGVSYPSLQLARHQSGPPLQWLDRIRHECLLRRKVRDIARWVLVRRSEALAGLRDVVYASAFTSDRPPAADAWLSGSRSSLLRVKCNQ